MTDRAVRAPDIGLANWLRLRAERTPSRRAISFEGMTLTYAALQRRIERVASRLAGLGVQKGDRVAYLGLNHPDFLASLFACARLGAIFVPLNCRLGPVEIADILDDCGACVLIADPAHAPLAEGMRDRIGGVGHLVCLAPRDGWATLEEEGAAPVAPQVPADPDDCVLILYTSGTTGRAKGVMLSHGNIWWNNVNSLHDYDVRQGDRVLMVAPLFHIGGLNVVTLLALQKGAEIVLHAGFDAGASLDAIEAHGITLMFGVPSIYQFVAAHPRFGTADLSSLRVLMCGGAPLPLPLIRAWEERGIAIHQGYGMTEASPLVTYLPAEHAREKAGSAGIAALYTEMRLVDREGKVVSGAGVPGEVEVRGPNVFRGYWNRPEETAAAFRDGGWFATGDVAFLDGDGFLTISDRVKDIIISGGENIAPAEVESALLGHPNVADVAVVGVPDPQWGEAVKAVIVARGEAPTLEELRSHAASLLARYKLPRLLEVVDVLPRNALGKVLKYELRRRHRGDAGS